MNGEDVGAGTALIDNREMQLQVVDVQAHMDKVELLSKAVDEADGWVQLFDEENSCAWTKVGDDGDTVMRMTIEFDLSPALFFAMMSTLSQDMLEWMSYLKGLEILNEFGPGDTLCRWNLNMGWAMMYIMSIPEECTVRLVTRPNWPQENYYCYCTIPYDPLKHVPVESYGPFKIESGCVMPHPDDPNKCILSSMDKLDFKYVPNFALKMLIKKEYVDKMRSMIGPFKGSSTYAALVKDQAE